jgi:nucleoside-diphosphate-sugar epimerase
MTSLRVLVTGGSGFIGTHLVNGLLNSGDQVLNLDIVAPKLPEHTRVWQQCDLLDEAALRGVVSRYRPTVIYNLAANADIAKHGEALAVNTRGLQNLINANLHLNTPAHLTHTSTQLVVGPQYSAQGPRDYSPYTEYGDTKAKSEELLWHSRAMPWTIARPTMVWGPWHPQFAKSIWRYIGKRWYLLPTGIDPVRSFAYVGNVVAQLMAIPNAPSQRVVSKVFYLSDEPVRSSVWLDGFSIAMTGKPIRRIPGGLLRSAALVGELSGKLGGPSPINLGRLYRMTTDYETPVSPTFDVLGRGPYTFDEGVKRSLAWLSSRDRAKGTSTRRWMRKL